MMGPKQEAQAALFYEFSLEHHVPQDHLLRSIDRFVDLSDIRQYLTEFYSHTGRPSIDPELLIRMLLVGYCSGNRQKLLVKKAELTQGRLLFLCQAFRSLLKDDHFVTLLRAEGLETMPSYLQDSPLSASSPRTRTPRLRARRTRRPRLRLRPRRACRARAPSRPR